MGVLCFEDENQTIEYVSEGNIVILNFKTQDDSWAKPISIHDGNILKKGVQMFMESIGSPQKKFKKAVYEPNSAELNLKSKISDLNINFTSNIIIHF